nr:uncharacterized protein LOC129057781 [Pongo abelii]
MHELKEMGVSLTQPGPQVPQQRRQQQHHSLQPTARGHTFPSAAGDHGTTCSSQVGKLSLWEGRAPCSLHSEHSRHHLSVGVAEGSPGLCPHKRMPSCQRQRSSRMPAASDACRQTLGKMQQGTGRMAEHRWSGLVPAGQVHCCWLDLPMHPRLPSWAWMEDSALLPLPLNSLSRQESRGRGTNAQAHFLSLVDIKIISVPSAKQVLWPHPVSE